MPQDKERLSQEKDLADAGGKARLFVEDSLSPGAEIEPSIGQAHYLLHVMRCRDGDRARLFNGHDGEWHARIANVSRRSCLLICETIVAEQSEVPDLWLAFAPIKKIPADYVAQKATELGVRRLMPVLTNRTIARRVNSERLRANAVEAAEQSGRLSVPEIVSLENLDNLLAHWPSTRKLIFCDEGGNALPVADALLKTLPISEWGILTGPEGGFDESERDSIRARPFVIPVTLGPRIMCADTAALAALAVWQALCGDWRRRMEDVL